MKAHIKCIQIHFLCLHSFVWQQWLWKLKWSIKTQVMDVWIWRDTMDSVDSWRGDSGRDWRLYVLKYPPPPFFIISLFLSLIHTLFLSLCASRWPFLTQIANSLFFLQLFREMPHGFTGGGFRLRWYENISEDPFLQRSTESPQEETDRQEEGE